MGADRAVVEAARRQHGVLTVGQLVAAGLSHDAVLHRAAQGWLRRVHRGVYLVGPLETPYSPAMAATLAIGPGALLSHYPATVLWGFRPPPAHTMHVIVPGRDVRSRDGIRTHTVAHLHPADATRHLGIPVTSPARALLDYAATATTRDLARATNEARVHRAVTDHSLNEQFQRYPKHRGTPRLRTATQTDPKLTRSEAERRLLELIRKARLPEPETNTRIAGWEVDFLWREHRLIVEVDGYAFHSARSSFERDRRKDRELSAHGFTVLRFTWRELDEEPVVVAVQLAVALRRN